MVPGARLELARPQGQWILNPPRLPIPPPGQMGRGRILYQNDPGFEPVEFFLTAPGAELILMVSIYP
jgi:hypothetical protein